MSGGAIVVFARAPRLGEVKTRLEPALGRERTHALYEAFLDDTLAAARMTGARVVLAHTHDPPRQARAADVSFPQRGDGFGARFDHALTKTRELLGPNAPFILVGADTPHLGPTRMRAALAALKDAPSVIGPSPEGGFHLVGFADRLVATRRAFDAPNDAANLARILRAAGLTPAITETWNDIDVPSDLVELLFHLVLLDEVDPRWVPDATRRILRSWGASVARDGDSTRGSRLILPAALGRGEPPGA